jgi:fibronectin type 3 domain-containing protein
VPPATPTSYNVKRGDYSTGESTITNVTGTGFVDTNVVIGSTYYYTISALNAYGEGPDSAEVSSAAFGVPTLQVRMPFDEIYTGSDYFTLSDTNLGLVDVTLTNYNYTASTYVFTDLHGLTNSGVGNNGQALNQTAVASQGGAPDLGSYVSAAPGLILGGLTNWTASIWFKASRTIGSSPATLFVIGQGGTTYAGLGNSIGVRTFATNQLSVRVNSGTDRLVTLPSRFVTNTWYFVAVTFDGANLRTYVGTELTDATLAGTTYLGPITVAMNTPGNLLIGNNIQSKTEAFAGWLDGFRFYSGASDANYIEGIRQAGLGAVLPFAPTGLTAVPNNSRVTLTWNPAVWAADYNVKRSTTSGANFVTLDAGTNVAGTNFTDLTAVNGTTYYYVVSGVGTNGEGANSLQASATPIAPPTMPTGLTATPGNSQIALSWAAVSGAASYNVKRSTSAGGEITVASVAGNGFTDTGLLNGTNYYYKVSAVNISGESPDSAEVSAQPVAPPLAPTGLTATPGNAQVGLTWTAAAGATSYNVKRSTASGAEVTITNVTTTSLVDANVINGTPYYYVVSALNLGGESPNSTPEVSATPTAPVANVRLTISLAETNVILTWPQGALQTIESVTGTYTNISGATSPYTNPATGPQQFFRVKVQ